MQQHRQFSTPLFVPALLLFLSIQIGMSCGVIPKKYPLDKPFVFKTTIKVEGSLTKEEKDALQSKLRTQLDDSLRSRTVSKLLYSTLPHPPVYDTTYVQQSAQYMHALLTSLGYFRD